MRPTPGDLSSSELPETGVIIGCGNVIEQDGLYLLVKESKRSARSRFNLPAGKPEVGESVMEAAEREAEEESGLQVRVDHLVGVYQCVRTSEGFSVVNFVFASTVIGGAIRVTATHPEVKYFTRDEIRELGRRRLLRGSHIELAVEAHLRGVRMPVDLVRIVPASPLPE